MKCRSYKNSGDASSTFPTIIPIVIPISLYNLIKLIRKWQNMAALTGYDRYEW